MTTRDSNWPEGTPCWVDLGVDDFDRAARFYSELFGWEIQRGPEEFGGYTSCTKDGRDVAGLMPKMEADQPSVWTTYLASDDLDVTMAKVRDSGGNVLTEPMDVADLGRMALAVDPGGAVVGFWQGMSHTGFRLANEVGSVTWSENFSRSWKANQEFYTAVAGWDYDEMSGDGVEYATFKVAGQPAGGIGQLGDDVPSEVPAYWNTYFKVADTDEAAARIRDLGGAVVRPAWDSPFGRMAAVADDQGAAFMIMAEPK